MSVVVFFLMIRRPPRSTLDRSSAASDVYKRQGASPSEVLNYELDDVPVRVIQLHEDHGVRATLMTVSYTHLRAHETVLDLVCRLLIDINTDCFNWLHDLFHL